MWSVTVTSSFTVIGVWQRGSDTDGSRGTLCASVRSRGKQALVPQEQCLDPFGGQVLFTVRVR